MTISIHTASAPIFVRMLGNLDTWLEKAQDHAEVRKFDSANYLSLRLAPDMLPFAAQVRVASDIARMAVARLADVEYPRLPDEETTLEALAERVRKSIAFIDGVDAARFDGADGRQIVLPQRSGDPQHFSGETFLQRWALPNVFFHLTTAYALLRQAGVEIGKADYLGTA
jgi:uncharacterized protein